MRMRTAAYRGHGCGAECGRVCMRAFGCVCRCARRCRCPCARRAHTVCQCRWPRQGPLCLRLCVCLRVAVPVVWGLCHRRGVGCAQPAAGPRPGPASQLCEGGCPFCRPHPPAASLPPRLRPRLSSSTEQSTSSRLIRKHKRRRRKQRLRQTDRVGRGGVRGGVVPAPWPCRAPHPRPFAGLLLQQHHGLHHVPEHHHRHAQHG